MKNADVRNVNGEPLWLVYDGECPFCASYVTYARVQKCFGPLNLVDVRGGGDLVNNIVALGFDLNDGMVLKYGDRYYHGAECVNILSLMSTRSGIFNKINAIVFQNCRVSNALYPLLRFGRNLTLKILRKNPIHDN